MNEIAYKQIKHLTDNDRKRIIEEIFDTVVMMDWELLENARRLCGPSGPQWTGAGSPLTGKVVLKVQQKLAQSRLRQLLEQFKNKVKIARHLDPYERPPYNKDGYEEGKEPWAIDRDKPEWKEICGLICVLRTNVVRSDRWLALKKCPRLIALPAFHLT